MGTVNCVVCNYNKRDFVLNCVESLFNQTFKDIRIIVVDNASTDDSVKALSERYGATITICVNSENLGGSGGFNAGLREALKTDSSYIMLIDNDVVLDEHCVEIMYNYMEKNKDVGILGPTVRMMRNPEQVQDLGGSIGEFYNMYGNYFADPDINLPSELESDYISTCAAMARTEAINVFGLMPEDNFIYWDDVEWSKKCQLAGYRTVAINEAKVWHNFQTANITAFNKYYLTRNRLNYFSKYLPDEKINDFIDKILEEIFSALFGYKQKGCEELFEAIIYAMDDYFHGIRGKADEYKIKPIINRKTPFEKLVENKASITINMILGGEEDNNNYYGILLYLIKSIVLVNPNCNIIISIDETGCTESDFYKKIEYELDRCLFRDKLPPIKVAKETEGDLVLQMCEHVRLLNDYNPKISYIDRYCNVISNRDEWLSYSMFDQMKAMFVLMYKPLFIQSVDSIRKSKS